MNNLQTILQTRLQMTVERIEEMLSIGKEKTIGDNEVFILWVRITKVASGPGYKYKTIVFRCIL
jgi:hypothetical protein